MSENPLASWLLSHPGEFRGPTEFDALALAYGAYREFAGDRALPYHSFVVALDKAGYSHFPQFWNPDRGDYDTRVRLPNPPVTGPAHDPHRPVGPRFFRERKE